MKLSISYQLKEWRDAGLKFSSEGHELGVLALEYHRPDGIMHAEGQISLRNFALETVQ